MMISLISASALSSKTIFDLLQMYVDRISIQIVGTETFWVQKSVKKNCHNS